MNFPIGYAPLEKIVFIFTRYILLSSDYLDLQILNFSLRFQDIQARKWHVFLNF